ncbi:GNAT family N-acetyltransferase [Curtobacterium sp. VKM Ac-1395]|uniref:GNAT family N-acetyltransferase n=1 Tax=Curtobacterium sp. VKM Ac-1395 TaxID=2783815 RepID=UPI00188BE969|nr:GNAT family N-acetyltransferase [Curtobacterium sp. VKM Ac-1395]MBF4591067.1 GNAT family N-acetyltransferase [Curtobacterium sp. VKM Ac-1395]
MAPINDDFSDRFDLREFTPGTDADGAPDARTAPWMDAVGMGFHEGTLSPESAARMAANFVEDGETFLGVYLREPFPGSVDETWPVGTFTWLRKGLSWGDGARVDTQAITGVTVRPTERRRGILRAMMTHALTRGVEQGYALASLTASEGTIYRRFGFGSAIRERAVSVRRNRALPFLAPTSGTVSVVPLAWLADGVGRGVFDRFHERTPGSMVRNSGTWPIVFGALTGDGEKAKDVRGAVHRAEGTDEIDGYVTWKVKDSGGQTTVEVVDLVYTDDAAYLSMWEFLLSIDLNDVVQYKRSRLDDPIVAALADNRAYDVDHEEDHVWLRVLDVAATLSSRPYAVDGSVTLAVSDAMGFATGTYRLDVVSGAGTVTRLSSDVLSEVDGAGVDVALDVADLGALLIGSVSPVTLAAAGLLRASDEAALRLRAMLLPPRTPHGITYF